jgi:hypothetical protein
MWNSWYKQKLAGETKVFGDNLHQCHFVHYKYHMTVNGFEPRLRFQVYISTLSVVNISCYISVHIIFLDVIYRCYIKGKIVPEFNKLSTTP